MFRELGQHSGVNLHPEQNNTTLTYELFCRRALFAGRLLDREVSGMQPMDILTFVIWYRCSYLRRWLPAICPRVVPVESTRY